MTEDIINDLKQFIAATVHQQTSDIKDDIAKIDSKVTNLDSKVSSLDSKVSSLDSKVTALDDKIEESTQEILSVIGESTEARFTEIEENAQELNTRLVKLETA